MIVRQETLIADLMRAGHDPADARRLLVDMEYFLQTMNETIRLWEARERLN
jgi:hypothetical protein